MLNRLPGLCSVGHVNYYTGDTTDLVMLVSEKLKTRFFRYKASNYQKNYLFHRTID